MGLSSVNLRRYSPLKNRSAGILANHKLLQILFLILIPLRQPTLSSASGILEPRNLR